MTQIPDFTTVSLKTDGDAATAATWQAAAEAQAGEDGIGAHVWTTPEGLALKPSYG